MPITRIEPYIVNSSANFTFAGINATSNLNVTGLSNLGPNGNVIITGGSNGQVLTTNGSGGLSWTTVSGGGGSANSISNGNSNVNIPSSNGNVTVSVAGNSNIAVFTGTGVNIAGTLTATGNITGNFFIGNGSQLTGLPSGTSISNGNSNVNIPAANGNVTVSVAGNANIVTVTGTGVNVAGNVSVTGNLSANNITTSGGPGNISGANVITAITFIGNTANINTALNVTGLSNLGPVGNVTITGGSSGQYLQTNGSGVLSWATISTSSISNGNSNVNIPSANGNVNISAVGNANVVVVTGTGINVAGTGTFTGNVTAGNFIGNITGANTITGNVFVGVFANGNSNMAIPTANSNINLSVAGNSNILVVTGTGVNVAGTSNTTGNIVGGGNLNISGNAVIGGNLTVNGNLAYVNVTDLSVSDPIIQLQSGPNGAAPTSNTGKDVGTALNYYDTSAKIAWMGWDVSNAEIAFGANVGISSEVVTFTSLANIRAGNAQLGNTVTANFLSGVLTTASQPNITSVGTLGSLNVSGVSNLGPVGNVRITGGSNGQVLTTNGNGGLSFTSVSSGSSLTVRESNSTGGNITNTIANISTLNFDKTTGIFVSDLGNGNALVALGSSFKTWVVNGQPNLVAVGEDTVQFIAGNGITITTSNVSNPKSITFTSTGGGGNAGNVIVDTFTGNGSQTVFTLSTTPTSEDYILVNIDGVLQLHNAYTLSGNSLTLSSAPVNSAAVEVQTWNMGSGGGGSGSNASFTVSNFTGDGSTANFAISNGTTVNNTLVTLNGVLQAPTTDYTISGNTLTFSTAPSSGQAIMFRALSGSGGGGGSALVIKDEGTNVATAATSIDFVGAGVTANATSNAVTVTIPGGATNARVTGYSLVFGG